MGLSERQREIKRRRHRRAKLRKLKARLEKATASEKAVIADKIRKLTPGAPVILQNWDLVENA